MSDQGFRELQLSSKQAVFLFMACVVGLVGTFLLGVSVGRGAGPQDAETKPTPTVAAGDQKPELPPSTPGANELKFPETLQGKSEPASPAPAAKSTPTPTSTPEPAATAKPTPTPTPTPPTKPAAATPAPKGAQVWYIPVDAFNLRDNADRRLADLKAKGFPNAKVFVAAGAGARYKVRVGPLDKEAADATFARLRKEGFKPSPPIR